MKQPATTFSARDKARLDRMIEAFRLRFDTDPTIGARAPGRVDLMGSHTDYNEGFVLTLTIDRDTWIVASPNDSSTAKIASLNMDDACEFSVEQFDSKLDGWGRYIQAVAYVLSKAGHSLKGFNAVLYGTVPIGSGLSSSASIEAATATMFEQLCGFTLSGLDKAKLCQKAENEWVGVNCGILDQYSSIMGDQGEALILDCRSLTHQYATLPDDLQPVICNTCAPRQLSGSEYGTRRKQCESGAEYFSKLDPEIKMLRDVPIDLFEQHKNQLPEDVKKRSGFIIQESKRVDSLAKALSENDHEAIRATTADSFFGARDLFEISVPAMQQMFDAMSAAPGCVGCRQAGAGFGGCMIAIVEQDKVDDFCQSVAKTYKQSSGITAEVYAVQTAPGAGPLAIQ